MKQGRFHLGWHEDCQFLKYNIKKDSSRFWYFLFVARTLVRQGITFRRTEEQNSNFVQIFQLLTRYMAALDTQYRLYQLVYLHTISQN
jgi:hypothetical protein